METTPTLRFFLAPWVWHGQYDQAWRGMLWIFCGIKELHYQTITIQQSVYLYPITSIVSGDIATAMYRRWYFHITKRLVAGWWLSPTPLKNDGQLVSWDDEIPKIWKNKIHVPNHQPGCIVCITCPPSRDFYVSQETQTAIRADTVQHLSTHLSRKKKFVSKWGIRDKPPAQLANCNGKCW